MNEVTNIIERIQRGDNQATHALLPLVYEELRRLATSRMKDERTAHTLSPTALVHEAYLRMVNNADDWNGRGHFFAAAAEAMRRILIDYARKKNSLKRGGDQQKVDLDPAEFILEHVDSDQLLELDEALGRLEKHDQEAAKIVKLRYFAGLTNKDAAQHIGISPRKADMLWAYARAWLKRELASSD